MPEAAPTNARLIMPPAATMQALQAAGRRRAEASLLASIAAGETPLNELHPAAVAAIVRALRQIGEDYTGRLFAIETAIACLSMDRGWIPVHLGVALDGVAGPLPDLERRKLSRPLLASFFLISGLSYKTTFNRELRISSLPLYSI